MRRTRYGMFVACALFLSACSGGSGSYANKPRPPAPVNLTVYINASRVSVSPDAVGAGPVAFTVTNAASQTESLMIQSPDGSQTLASTGPINPQSTAQVTVDFRDPGDYTVQTKTGGNDSQQATISTIQPAIVHIGTQRKSGSNQLLLP